MSSESIYSDISVNNTTPSIIEDRRFYVYVYFDPFTREPFYVGKGTGNRAWDHLKEAYRGGSYRAMRHSKIKSIYNKGKLPIIIIAYVNLTEQQAFAYEQSLIAHYGRRDLKTGCLTNMSDGGEGNTGHKYCSDECVYTLYHITGEIKNFTRLEFRENICNGNHQTCSAFFTGRNETCNGWSFKKDSRTVEDWVLFNTPHKFINVDTNEVIEIDIKSCDGVFTKKEYKNLVKGKRLSVNRFCLIGNEGRIKRTGQKHYFTNIITGETIFATQKELSIIIGQSSNIGALIDGKITHLNFWVYGSHVDEETSIRYNPHKTFVFENLKTGEIRKMTISELKEVLPKKSTECYDIARGKVRKYGWQLKKRG